MYADYYSSTVNICENDNFDCTKQTYNKYTVVIEAPNYNLKLGAYKILTAKVYDAENNDVTNMFKDSKCIWDFKIDEANLIRKKLVVVDENYSLKEDNKFKCKFKFDGDEQYLSHKITASCQIDNLTANVSLDVLNL